MRSRWSDSEAADFVARYGAAWGEALALRTYSARLLGAESGLVNVMQQVGGSLGLAVLVTVFGSASKSAQAHLDPSLSATEAARRVFVTGIFT